MPNPFFRFKQFTVHHDRSAMKVTTDACLFGAWVADAIGSWQKETAGCGQLAGHQWTLLDIGTGTGLLSLMIAQKTAGTIDAVEIDSAAAAQAAENSAASPWKERISIIPQDVLQWEPGKKYDCIFSNPPFYQNELRSGQKQKNLAHHDEGLLLSDLFRWINKHLSEEGRFFLLLPAKREAALEQWLLQNDLFLFQKLWVQQTLKHPPFRVMIQGRRKSLQQPADGVLVIKDENDVYTPAFSTLLKDYYLYL